MAGKRQGVVILADDFMAFGVCRIKRRVRVETPAGPEIHDQPLVDAECFFSEDGRSVRDKMMYVQAKVACSMCPVRVECLEFSLAARIEYGIWGGKDRHQRADILSLRRRRSARRIAV